MRRPPCGDLGGLSWGCAVLRGRKRADLGRTWVSPGPYDVRRPSGAQPAHRPTAEAAGGPPWTSTPLQSSITGTPYRPAGCPASQTALPLLGLLRPTTHAGSADPSVDSGSLRRRVPRAGFGYPLRDFHRRPSRRVERAGASMGFTLQGFPLAAIGAPLGAPALLSLPGDARPTPEDGADEPDRLQGLVPATSPC
jgi:hypothetical protein